MTEQTAEILSVHFRNTPEGEPKTKQAYRALWIAYQRGALSADELLRSMEHELLRSMDQLEARWAAVKC
jgi:hypothetical protein